MVSHQESVVCVVNRKLGFDPGALRVNAICDNTVCMRILLAHVSDGCCAKTLRHVCVAAYTYRCVRYN